QNAASVRFSGGSSGRPLEILVNFKDGTFAVFDANGTPVEAPATQDLPPPVAADQQQSAGGQPSDVPAPPMDQPGVPPSGGQPTMPTSAPPPLPASQPSTPPAAPQPSAPPAASGQ